MGPPPGGPLPLGPAWAPPPIKPSAGWYALPVAFLVAAVLSIGLMAGLAVNDPGVASMSPVSGDPRQGVAVDLTEGHNYFLYVRGGQSAPYACAVQQGSASSDLRLTRKNSWSANDNAGYSYAATFEAPVSGQGLLICHGPGGRVLVTPDDTQDFYLGMALIVGLPLMVFAVVGFVFVAIRRNNARRRRDQALDYPY
ncbi:hypothetical protein [Actinomadura terrae]|uniref:hypothetical protein n=1 Tax=Actinomadura terrae TaxID=604353 RepID=UPI001FA6C249|nr:hypothetical protein [Actinomadura terrae]